MAKQHQDKEDILREASALVNRIELEFFLETGSQTSVVVGFRRSGAVSFFFGAEPVYQFNTQHAFRRGYYEDAMLKADQGKIVQLTRTRDGEQLILLRREYNDDQTKAFVAEMKQVLWNLHSVIQSQQYRIAGANVQHGTGEELVEQIVAWIEDHVGEIQIAAVPNVEG